MHGQKIWASILTGVRSQVSSSVYKTWFSGSTLLSVKKSGERDILVVGTKNSFLKEQLETKYLPIVIQSAKSRGLGACEVIFVVSRSPAETRPKEEPLFTGVAPTLVNSYRKSEALSPNHTFENFVVGASNNLAYLAFTQASASIGSAYNPLFVWGSTGVGKTHLLQAFGNYVLSKVLDSRVLYASAEKFTNDFIESLHNHTTAAFRQKYRGVDVLLVDDVQFLAGKESTQDEFFFTFNELALSGRQLVIASDKHPKDLVRVKDRLTNRFMGGMTVDVGQADLELRTAILAAKCREKNFELADDILGYIASVCEGGARELEGALVHVLTLFKLTSGKITLDEIKNTIRDTSKVTKRAVPAGAVIEAVCRYFKVARGDLCGPRRKASFVYPRQVSMFLLRQDLGLALSGVGELLGGRDHSTVLHGVDKVARVVARDTKKRDEISRIRASF